GNGFAATGASAPALSLPGACAATTSLHPMPEPTSKKPIHTLWPAIIVVALQAGTFRTNLRQQRAPEVRKPRAEQLLARCNPVESVARPTQNARSCNLQAIHGEVAERLNALVLKTSKG